MPRISVSAGEWYPVYDFATETDDEFDPLGLMVEVTDEELRQLREGFAAFEAVQTLLLRKDVDGRLPRQLA